MRGDLHNLISEHFLNGGTITDDEDLLLSGLIDSLGVVRLVGMLEKKYSVTIPAEDVVIEHFGSVAMIANYLEKRCSV